MIIAIDLDGTLVDDSHAYDDLTTPLRLKPNAREALLSLKKAGHRLVLWSARASRSLLKGPEFDILVRAGVKKANEKTWERTKELHQARYIQMIDFVEEELDGVFDAIDDGLSGKPAGVDLFIDDRAIRFGEGPLAVDWVTIAQMYGEPAYSEST